MKTIPKWKCKDGRKIAVKDMDTDHIQSALTMLKKHGYVSANTFNFYMTCTPPTADGALMAFERELDEWLDKIPNEFIDIFAEELKVRQ